MLLNLARHNRLRVPESELASFAGKDQSLRLPVRETGFRLRALYDKIKAVSPKSSCGRGEELQEPDLLESRPGRRSHQRVTHSHAAMKGLQYWRDLRQEMHHRPIWPVTPKPTSTVHMDASMTAFGATLFYGEQPAGNRGYSENSGFWDLGDTEVAHITIFELMTVRLSLENLCFIASWNTAKW